MDILPLVWTENKLKEISMNEEEKLGLFKEEFVKGYVDRHLDRLLDLRNAIQSAESFDGINDLMKKEYEFIRAEFELTPKPEIEPETKNEDKKADMS